ncbi:hypothetical protein CCR75_006617 [Bremia lactucae]|uniref:Sulfatase N-terminal domain-containing protein n=1 Tax=Bremia lactucae TaxID=4779 RepID=A0A976IC54_BRELC|nr:hypothetical protein CCR75_006617 [Bremia lactucae]
MKAMAKKKYNITKWVEEKRKFRWGVHDDLSFQLLGDLLVEKKHEQRQRVARGEFKKPTFVTHYTISSHETFKSWPTWYDKADKPDFSVMFKGDARAERIERYMKVRYFTDLELGKFMDRMEQEGIFNDTIVILAGDHGQAPEVQVVNSHEESVTRVPLAIIAEGRLGDAVGKVFDDVAVHYDLLNTIADITGLPKDGFVQDGVGRSLKRKIPSGQRVVYANDPTRKMAVMRGHQRLHYDAVADAMFLHDTELDYFMSLNLLPLLSDKEREDWVNMREDGRQITAYYKKRWDENCLLAVTCKD